MWRFWCWLWVAWSTPGNPGNNSNLLTHNISDVMYSAGTTESNTVLLHPPGDQADESCLSEEVRKGLQ